MTLDGWGELACGSNGGPPRQELDAWSGFKTCPPEPNGLHQVDARFDDEDEFVAKALGEPAYAAQRTGTRVAGHPVVLSALFDDGGFCAPFAWSAIRARHRRSAAWRTCSALR